MTRRVISLLLATIIAACPFFCTINGALAKVGGGSSHTCCDCCHESQSADRTHDSDSKHRPANSGKACQCICGGAVSEIADVPSLGIDTSVWTHLPVQDVAVLSASDTLHHFSIAQLQPDDGTNVGRAARCLFMSFLC